MGFLRKVGKKIKKGVKKLMRGTFGKVLGGAGLAMMFWGGANALFGNMDWFKTLSSRMSKVKPFGNTSIGDTISQLDKANFADLGVSQKIAKAGVEVGKGFYTAGESIGEKIKNPFTKDFIPDVTKSVVTNVALDAVSGTPEQPFVGGGIMPTPVQEQAQGAYMADLNTSMPQSGIQNFQQAQQSLLYGTLSPFYLQEQARMYS